MPSERFLPISGYSLDRGSPHMTNDIARYLKNVVYSLVDTSQTGTANGSQTGVFKPIESVEVYDPLFALPASGNNQFGGGYYSEKTNESLFFNINENGSHGLYKINGETRRIETVYNRSYLNLQLAPEHFIHEGGAYLKLFDFTDPNTNLPRRRSYFMWVDGHNDFRFICIEDSIATSGFDPILFPYFEGSYDPTILINAGVPTPLDCITVTEVPNETPTKPNNLKFRTWQFRVTFIDVYGRPSEHGIISHTYVPGVNDCLSGSDLISRCLDLSFFIDNPLIDKVQIEFRNCNDEQWYLDTVLSLYEGSNLGDWWTRGRNASVPYNPETKTVTYRFCKDKECNPIPTTETNRTQNPMPMAPQSVAPIGNTMGLANDRDGFNPIQKSELDKISVEIIQPEETGANTSNIEVFLQVYNPIRLTTQMVWVLENQGVFGGLSSIQMSVATLQQNGSVPGIEWYDPSLINGYAQVFGSPQQRGFIGYLAGTGEPPISTISEQYYVDASNNFVKVDNYAQFDFRRKYFQKFTFNSVTKGTYVFRVAGHRSELSDQNFHTTSTYVAGSFPWNGASKIVNHSVYSDIRKEIVIDVCNGNYSSVDDNKILVIWDLSSPGVDNSTQALEGYVSETAENGVQQIPVEMLLLEVNRGSDFVYTTSRFTDHNGFFFATSQINDYTYHLYGYCGCNNYIELAKSTVGNNPQVYVRNIILDQQLNKCPSYHESICNRVLIKGFVFLCGTNVPVPGIGVVYGRGQTAITGADGEFTIIAHDNNFQAGQPRIDNIYFTPTICPYTDCDGNCLPSVQVVITPCQTCVERIITIPSLGVTFEVNRGLLSGGNYGVGLNMYDWLGRHSFVQTKDSLYVTMPTTIETKTSAPSQLKLIIPPGTIFPPGIVKITPVITKELSLQGYVEWIVDRVEFIDNSGNENAVAPTQIKIYYASLNEYNVQNNFNTTTHWQFIVQEAPQINYTSDFVEFYINGDGEYFPTLVRALVKYDQAGQYFLIDYDSSLKNLTQYAKIRLNRPATCQTRDVFFELCQPINVVNGQAQQQEIILNAFDTYYKYRQIPIPVPIDDDETENIIRTFGFPFEHNSPSDFWGQGCGNFGRINVRNPYEAEIVRKNQVALSGILSDNGQLNFLNYFDDAKKTNFIIDVDGIVSMLPEQGVVLMVCQDNCFIVGYNDNLLRVVGGNVQQASADDRFGRPERKIGGNYGCVLFDKNTIRKKEGFVQFLDSSEAALVQHNYVTAIPVSENIIGSWLRPKVKYIENWNRSHDNKKYWFGGIDPAANAYLLSDFTIGSNEYTNQERGTNIEKHESLSFDIYTKAFRSTWMFTPQGYIMLDTDLLERQLFSFAKGQVYYHYSTDPNKTYGMVYGEVAERVIRFVAVLDSLKKKTPLSLSNYCVQSKYFSDQVLTDSGQVSRILLEHFKQGNFFSAAGFLCDLNTPTDPNIVAPTGVNKITDGNNLVASTIDIRLIGDPAKNQVYSEYNGSIVSVFGAEQSGT